MMRYLQDVVQSNAVGAGQRLARGDFGPRSSLFAKSQSAERYFAFSHSVTWMRYSFHSRRLSST